MGEQPQMSQISLKTSGATSSNANPWRASNINGNATSPTMNANKMNSGFGGNRKGFGSRSINDSPSGNGPNRPFGTGLNSGKSKFGGGSASSSKFANSSGFGASVLKNMDTGDPRLHYGKSNRFSSLRNNDSTSSTPRATFEKPSPSNSSRFNLPEQESFPELKPATKPITKEKRKVDDMSIEELKQRLKENKPKTKTNPKKESQSTSPNNTTNNTANGT